MNRAAAAIFLVLLCSACPKRLEFGPEGRIEDAPTLYQHVRERQAQVVNLEGDAKLRVESPQGSGTLGNFLAITRPGLIHLETYDFFNRPVASRDGVSLAVESDAVESDELSSPQPASARRATAAARAVRGRLSMGTMVGAALRSSGHGR